MKPFVPRFYQVEATEAIIWSLLNEPNENPVVAIPTGGGKSAIIGMVAKRLLQLFPGLRVGVATHVKELVQQDYDAIRKVWPNAPVGIYSAGLGKKVAVLPITVTTVQSAVKAPEKFGKINVLIIDECQLLSPDDESNYQKFIKELRKKCPGLVIIGLSATPYRMKQGLITDGGILTKIVYDITGRDAFVRLIEMGFLCPLIAKPTDFRYDVSKVKTVAGEFNLKDLEKEVNTHEQTVAALNEALQIGEDRNHWLVFCSGVAHINSVHKVLLDMGESATFVHSKMSKTARDENIQLFMDRKVRMIVSDNILRVGFDAPFVDHIVLLCPTRSPGRHVQTLGRGTRVVYSDGYDLETTEGRLEAIAASPKQNCRVSDFAGNIERLGPINDPVLPKSKKKGGGEVPIKICPICDMYNHAAARHCEVCGHEFDFEKAKIETTATSARVVADRSDEKKDTYDWYKVDRIEYHQEVTHVGSFRPPFVTLVVTYFCGMSRYYEKVCFEKGGEVTRFSNAWWRLRLPQGVPLPETTLDGMQIVHRLPIPTHIKVLTSDRKIPRVVQVTFDGVMRDYTPAVPSFMKQEIQHGETA